MSSGRFSTSVRLRPAATLPTSSHVVRSDWSIASCPAASASSASTMRWARALRSATCVSVRAVPMDATTLR